MRFCRAIGINMSRSNSNGRCVFATISIVREGERDNLVESYYKHVIQKKITTTENLYVK